MYCSINYIWSKFFQVPRLIISLTNKTQFGMLKVQKATIRIDPEPFIMFLTMIVIIPCQEPRVLVDKSCMFQSWQKFLNQRKNTIQIQSLNCNMYYVEIRNIYSPSTNSTIFVTLGSLAIANSVSHICFPSYLWLYSFSFFILWSTVPFEM